MLCLWDLPSTKDPDPTNPVRGLKNFSIGATYERSIRIKSLRLESAVRSYELTHPLRQFVESILKYHYAPIQSLVECPRVFPVLNFQIGL